MARRSSMKSSGTATFDSAVRTPSVVPGRSNVERAISSVLSDQLELDYFSVRDAYEELFGADSPNTDDSRRADKDKDGVTSSRLPNLHISMTDSETLIEREVSTPFERALDKYVDERDRLDSPFAGIVSRIRKEILGYQLEGLLKMFGNERIPCPCCGIKFNKEEMRVKLGLADPPPELRVQTKRKSKSKSTGRKTKKNARSQKTIEGGQRFAFDPYAPSTSTNCM